MSTDCGLRGLDLLDAAIEQIEQHPETWRQDAYRCKSGMCVAGWACELAGGRWVNAPDVVAPWTRALLVAEAEDRPDNINLGAVHAATRAKRLFGFSKYMDEALGKDGDDRNLFDAENSLDDIKAMRDDLRAKFAEVAS